MLDTYTQRNYNDSNCYRGDIPLQPGETECPVKMEASYIENYETFPLINTLTKTNFGVFSNESLADGTLKKFI